MATSPKKSIKFLRNDLVNKDMNETTPALKKKGMSQLNNEENYIYHPRALSSDVGMRTIES